MGDHGDCGDRCEGRAHGADGVARARPLVACESCGRHVRRDAERCPFCAKAGPTWLRGALVAAAFFGAAAIPGCAYGPPPDDLDGSSDGDASSEVQADAPDSAFDAASNNEVSVPDSGRATDLPDYDY